VTKSLLELDVLSMRSCYIKVYLFHKFRAPRILFKLCKGESVLTRVGCVFLFYRFVGCVMDVPPFFDLKKFRPYLSLHIKWDPLTRELHDLLPILILLHLPSASHPVQ